jgi:hypothetical protein
MTITITPFQFIILSVCLLFVNVLVVLVNVCITGLQVKHYTEHVKSRLHDRRIEENSG